MTYLQKLSIVIRRNFEHVPTIIKVYLAFALVVSMFFPVILTQFPNTYKLIVPQTGWSPSMPYMFSLVMAVPFFIKNKNITQSVVSFIFAAIVQLAFGIYSSIKIASDLGGNNSNNPYLTVGQYQYIWTVVIPIVWIVCLLITFFKLKKFSKHIQSY